MRIAKNDWIAEARDAATVLGRSVSFAADIMRIGDARLAGANVAHGEAALNQKKMESIRNHLAGTAKDRALTQADVDAYASSYVFGERTARRSNDPVEAEALELARRLVRKKVQTAKENTEAARELLQSEKGDAIRAQAAKRVAELKDLMIA